MTCSGLGKRYRFANNIAYKKRGGAKCGFLSGVSRALPEVSTFGFLEVVDGYIPCTDHAGRAKLSSAHSSRELRNQQLNTFLDIAASKLDFSDVPKSLNLIDPIEEYLLQDCENSGPAL